MRLVIGMTGATGAPICVRVLEALQAMDVETHLVISRWARTTLQQETGRSVAELSALATASHKPDDQAAAISSGSFRTDGMIVAPCSMRTLVTRETPLSVIHLENMLALSRMGTVIFPPVPAFYNEPSTIAELVEHLTARILDQFDLNLPTARRWSGLSIRPALTVRTQ
jgi:4-hydroxy-3-polyprenylbenzoate decarboxylase